MSKRLRDWILLAIVIVAGFVVCLLTSVIPNRVDASRPVTCPYPTEMEPCPYQLDR